MDEKKNSSTASGPNDKNNTVSSDSIPNAHASGDGAMERSDESIDASGQPSVKKPAEPSY